MDKQSVRVRTVGILGGGQLGRMLSVAASRLGLKTHIFEPAKDPVAAHVAHLVTTADYTDEGALTRFAKSVDVVTFEFENVPVAAVNIIEPHCRVLPGRNALSSSQDRLVEKDFLSSLGLKTAPYANVERSNDIENAVVRLGVPSILKTRRLGYDGKGQVRLTHSQCAAGAWDELGRVPCILEGMVRFEREISVIAARSLTGEVVCYTPGENVHRHGILHTTTVPAAVTPAERDEAIAVATRILQALDYVGVMGVELFVTAEGIVVNEIAPRVHNSGHWTQNGCVIDQFEQHIRAVAGYPLGDGARHSNVVMTNFIGAEVFDAESFLRDPQIGVHLYGKPDATPGRKMGHYNRITGRA